MLQQNFAVKQYSHIISLNANAFRSKAAKLNFFKCLLWGQTREHMGKFYNRGSYNFYYVSKETNTETFS